MTGDSQRMEEQKKKRNCTSSIPSFNLVSSLDISCKNMLLIPHSVLWAAMHLTPFMHFYTLVHDRFTLIETEDVPRRHTDTARWALG